MLFLAAKFKVIWCVTVGDEYAATALQQDLFTFLLIQKDAMTRIRTSRGVGVKFSSTVC